MQSTYSSQFTVSPDEKCIAFIDLNGHILVSKSLKKLMDEGVKVNIGEHMARCRDWEYIGKYG